MQVSASPSSNFAAVTPSDSADLTNGKCRALFIGGAGNIVVTNDAGTAVTFSGLAAGVVLPISTKRVRSTSTTATAIVALY